MSILTNPSFEPGPILPIESAFRAHRPDAAFALFGRCAEGGDIHDHLGLSPNGDVTWGTTTIRLPGFEPIHLRWLDPVIGHTPGAFTVQLVPVRQTACAVNSVPAAMRLATNGR